MCQLTFSYSQLTARLPEIVALHTDTRRIPEVLVSVLHTEYQTFINAVRNDGVRHVRILAH